MFKAPFITHVFPHLMLLDLFLWQMVRHVNFIVPDLVSIGSAVDSKELSVIIAKHGEELISGLQLVGHAQTSRPM